MIFVAIYFQFISDQWIYFYIIPIALCAILTLLIILAPESPKFLYEIGNFQRARNVINIISKINKGHIHENPWTFDIEPEHTESGIERSP